MKLESSAFKEGENIPKKYTCQGADISPELSWSGVPEGTKSLALICDDPDAPMGTWVHWLICNISPSINKIEMDSVPAGAKQVKNDFGKLDYGGPCPPSGTHRYFFKLFALNVDTLDGVNEKNFYDLVENATIEKAVLIGKYKKY